MPKNRLFPTVWVLCQSNKLQAFNSVRGKLVLWSNNDNYLEKAFFWGGGIGQTPFNLFSVCKAEYVYNYHKYTSLNF